MFKGKKINVFEDKYGLSIDFKWWSPMAIPLALFAFFWDGFLIMWYIMGLSMGAPLIFLIFPIIHIAVGVYLTYTSLCMIFNKTLITVTDGYLKIAHSPIPWWKGNFEMAAEDIEQLYVKETITKGKRNRITQRYHLRAKLENGEDVSVLSVSGIESQDVLLIEEKLEKHIGINDQIIKGEYGRSETDKIQEQPRRQRRYGNKDQNALNLPIEVGDVMSISGKKYTVSHLSQFDWKNGESDRSIQLLDENENAQLLYVAKDQGLITTYLEHKQPLLNSSEIFFLKANPSKSLTFEGKTYLLNAINSGTVFLSAHDTPIPVEQWFYIDLDKESAIRIEVHDNLTTYYLAKKIDKKNISVEEDRLELRELNFEKNYEQGYRDEDLV